MFHKGERKAKIRIWKRSGITVVVSDASVDDLARQVQDTIEFVRENQKELSRLRGFDGLEDMELDFAVYSKNGFLQSSVFPAESIALAGNWGIGIELSMYGEDED